MNNAEDAWMPVCDQPGVRCGIADARWKTMLRTQALTVRLCLSISFSIYILGIPQKVEWFTYLYDKSVDHLKED